MDEDRPGVFRAVGDGGQHPPLGQRQAVPSRRILPAEPVERLAQEPQLTQPGGGDGGQSPGIGRAEYGGFLMSLPARRMYDVWADPDYDFAETKAEKYSESSTSNED